MSLELAGVVATDLLKAIGKLPIHIERGGYRIMKGNLERKSHGMAILMPGDEMILEEELTDDVLDGHIFIKLIPQAPGEYGIEVHVGEETWTIVGEVKKFGTTETSLPFITLPIRFRKQLFQLLAEGKLGIWDVEKEYHYIGYPIKVRALKTNPGPLIIIPSTYLLKRSDDPRCIAITEVPRQPLFSAIAYDLAHDESYNYVIGSFMHRIPIPNIGSVALVVATFPTILGGKIIGTVSIGSYSDSVISYDANRDIVTPGVCGVPYPQNIIPITISLYDENREVYPGVAPVITTYYASTPYMSLEPPYQPVADVSGFNPLVLPPGSEIMVPVGLERVERIVIESTRPIPFDILQLRSNIIGLSEPLGLVEVEFADEDILHYATSSAHKTLGYTIPYRNQFAIVFHNPYGEDVEVLWLLTTGVEDGLTLEGLRSLLRPLRAGEGEARIVPEGVKLSSLDAWVDGELFVEGELEVF